MQTRATSKMRGGRHLARRRTGIFYHCILILLIAVTFSVIGLHTLGRTVLRAPLAYFNTLFETAAPDEETMERLHTLASQDARVQDVIDNYQAYPADILTMLSKNLDMLDFVLDYPEKKGQVFDDTIGEAEIGTIPLLLQYDQRWGYGKYGSSSVVVSGCGPACLSMVIAGLTGENTATPYVVAQYANKKGYYVPGAGTSWKLMSEGAVHFGVEGKELPLVQSLMERALNQGQPIICSVRAGDFTATGHFIVITGMEDGQFTVNDPNSTERSSRLWDYETLAPQISNLWAFQATKQ